MKEEKSETIQELLLRGTHARQAIQQCKGVNKDLLKNGIECRTTRQLNFMQKLDGYHEPNNLFCLSIFSVILKS